jgi:hypothetical protein
MAQRLHVITRSDHPYLDYLDAIGREIDYNRSLGSTVETLYKLATMCRIDYGIGNAHRTYNADGEDASTPPTVIGMWGYAPQGRKGIRVVIYTWYGILQLTEIIDPLAEQVQIKVKLRAWVGSRTTDHMPRGCIGLISQLRDGITIDSTRSLQAVWTTLQYPLP